MIVLFDMGNVIAPPIDEKELYEKIKAKVPYDKFLEYWRTDQTVVDAHKGLIEDQIHVKSLLEFSQSPITEKEFYSIYFSIDKGTFSNTMEIIHRLKEKGIKIGILSNLRRMDYTRHAPAVDYTLFDYLFFSYEMHLLKPDKEIYNEAIKKCNANPKYIYFFDDRPENVEAARKCGIQAYCVTGNTIKEVFNTITL